MASYIKFLAGHLEKMEYRCNSGRNKLHCYNKPFFGPTLYLTDFTSMEIVTEENVKKLGGMLGGALVGNFLFGGVGALAGGLAGGNEKESTVVVTFRGGQRALAKVNSPFLTSLQSHLFKLAEDPSYATKAKPSGMLKKIAIGFGLVMLIGGVLSALDKTDKESSVGPAGNTAAHTNPCAKIKTMDDWNKADEVWKKANAECMPQKQLP